MTALPRYTKEEFARRGDAIYENELRSVLEKANEGKFVVIDIETGAYEVDRDELAASDRLLGRLPDAQIWLRRIGSRYARHFPSHVHRPHDYQLRYGPCEAVNHICQRYAIDGSSEA
jgi:hypothetical protein